MQGKPHYPLESRYMKNILQNKLCFQTQCSSIIAQVPVICQTQASFQLYRWQKFFCDILLTITEKSSSRLQIISIYEYILQEMTLAIYTESMKNVIIHYVSGSR